MVGFIKTIFIKLLNACAIGSFAESLISNLKRPIKCVSLFYPFTVTVNKSGGSFNTTDGPYAQVFVENKAKDLNVKVVISMSGVNETMFVIQHESCGCKCIFN